jgi:hypothetical protein
MLLPRHILDPVQEASSSPQKGGLELGNHSVVLFSQLQVTVQLFQTDLNKTVQVVWSVSFFHPNNTD